MSNRSKIKDLAKPIELNDEQEKFAREIVKHNDRLKALRIAYPTSNYTDKSGYVRASQLLQNEKIVRRIEELQLIVLERALKESEYNLDVGTRELMDLIEEAKSVIDEKGLNKTASDVIIRCVQELNKMYKLTTSTNNSLSVSNKDGGKIMFVNASDVPE